MLRSIQRKKSPRSAGILALAVVIGVIASAGVTPAVAADTWTGTRSCSSPATQGRLASTTTGNTKHVRDGVQTLYAAGGYNASFHPIGTHAYKVEANSTIASVTFSCIGI